jgi:hypothetical protein
LAEAADMYACPVGIDIKNAARMKHFWPPADGSYMRKEYYARS